MLHFDRGYLKLTITMPCQKIRANYILISEYKRDHAIGMKRLIERMEKWLDMWVEAMQRLDDADKSGSITTDASVRTAVVDLGPQQNEKKELLPEQLSQHRMCRYQLRVARKYMTNMTLCRRLRVRQTVTPLTSHVCIMPSLIMLVKGSINLQLQRLETYSF